MPIRPIHVLLAVAGALAPAIAASGLGAGAQIPPVTLPTTTTTAAPTTTTAAPTTTTAAPTTTVAPTTTAAPTTTTAAPGGGGGSLGISVPATASLSNGTPVTASSLSASLGTVSVNDTRGGVSGGWIVTVVATDFVTGGATAAETIGKANVSYWSGPTTASSGAGVFTPGQPTAADAATLALSRVAFTAVASGATSASWAPTVKVTLPTSAVVGQYRGTITHSVA